MIGALALPCHGFSVGGQDVDFMGSPEFGSFEFPDDLFVRGEFENVRHAVVRGAVAANDHVSVVEKVAAAGIGEAIFDVFAGGDPDRFSVLVEDNRLVAVGEVGHDLVVLEKDGGEGPVFLLAAAELRKVGFDSADDFAIGFVFLDGEGKEVWNEVVSIWEFAGHAGLHVGVVGLRLERAFDGNGAIRRDLQETGFFTEFGDEGVPVGESLGGADFAIWGSEFVVENDFALPREFFHFLREGDQNVAVGEDRAVARLLFDLPRDLTVFVDDGGPGPGDEKGVLDSRFADLFSERSGEGERGSEGEGDEWTDHDQRLERDWKVSMFKALRNFTNHSRGFLR